MSNKEISPLLWTIWPCNFSLYSFAISSYVCCICEASPLPKHRMNWQWKAWMAICPTIRGMCLCWGGWHQCRIYKHDAWTMLLVKQGQAHRVGTGSRRGPGLGLPYLNLGVYLLLLIFLSRAWYGEVDSPLDVNDNDIKYSNKSCHGFELTITQWNQNES